MTQQFRTADERTVRRSSSWRHDGSFHVLMAFEKELNPIYADQERPLLHNLFHGAAASDEVQESHRLVLLAAE